MKFLKDKKNLLINIAFGFFVATSILFLSQKGLLRRLELASLDFSFQIRGNLKPNPHIVIIEINDYDITKIGRWPWKRTWHAAMATALKKLGAKDVYFDIIFSEASSEEEDSLLEQALEESKNVYLPFVFQTGSYDIKEAFLPIERFATHIKGTGAINVYPDIDGTIRRMPLIFQTEKGPFPHMALRIALDYTGMKIKDIKPRYLLATKNNKEIKIPLIEKNTLLLNWLGKWEDSFKHYSFLDVLAKYQKLVNKEIPASQLSDFKDSICIVAVTAIGLYDIKPVPLQPEYPGSGILATALNNLIDGGFLDTPPGWVNIFILYLLSLLPAFLIFGEKPLKENMSVFSIGVTFFAINYILLKNNFIMDVATPMLGLFVSALSVGVYNFVHISIERQNFFKMAVTDGLTGLYNIKYFKMLLETEIALAKSDPAKKFAIVMSDVDHFKHFNDTYGHQVGDLVLKEVANTLKVNVRSSDLVSRYGGEEMIVLLRGANLKDGLLVAEKLRSSIENAILKDEKNTYKVTVSLGVSTFTLGDNVDSLIKRADDGLYKAKETGRNRVSYMEQDFAHIEKNGQDKKTNPAQ